MSIEAAFASPGSGVVLLRRRRSAALTCRRPAPKPERCRWLVARTPAPDRGGQRPPVPVDEAVRGEPPTAPLVCFCDIDGTTLSSDNTLCDANKNAIVDLPYPRVKFIPATGKSRAGALASFGVDLRALLRKRYPGGVPGVYLQGLVCYGEDGKLIWENALPPSVCRRTVEVSRELNLDLIAYARDGDSILCEKRTSEIDKVIEYHEPMPEEIGSWETVVDSVSIQKFLFMAPEARILETRPAVEKALLDHAEITRATEGMLEVLPRGASKAAGVARLRKHLGVDATECFAIGDGENDVGLLKENGISVAMSNAVPAAKAAALYTTSSNDEAGLAEALDRFVFKPLEGED